MPERLRGLEKHFHIKHKTLFLYQFISDFISDFFQASSCRPSGITFPPRKPGTSSRPLNKRISIKRISKRYSKDAGKFGRFRGTFETSEKKWFLY